MDGTASVSTYSVAETATVFPDQEEPAATEHLIQAGPSVPLHCSWIAGPPTWEVQTEGNQLNALLFETLPESKVILTSIPDVNLVGRRPKQLWGIFTISLTAHFSSDLPSRLGGSLDCQSVKPCPTSQFPCR